MKKGLTKRQKEYLDWIKEYIDRYDGQAPSYEEIGQAMNTTTSSAQRIVGALIDRGHLVNTKGLPRTLAIAGER